MLTRGVPLFLFLFQQDDGNFAGLIWSIYVRSGICVGLLFFVVTLIGAWGVFRKANHPGWSALLPIYNVWILLKIVGRPGWWLILYFIPVVGQLAWMVNMWDLARSFEQGVGYAVGLIILPFIFLLLLGFDDMRHYYGPAAL